MRIRIAARAALLALLPAALAAQPVLGGGEDATLPRRGRARFRLGVLLESATDRFGAQGSATDSRQAIGSGATFDTLGVRFLPTLAPLQDSLRTLTGSPDLLASLGALRTQVRVDVQSLPFGVEYGVLDRVALSVSIPYVRTRSSVNPTIDPVGGGGNLGLNPARSNVPAATANGTLFTQLGRAVDSLQSLATACGVPTPTDPRCGEAFDAARATALLREAQAFRGGVAYVYGTGTTAEAGRAFVPIAGSPTQRVIEARVRDLATRFGAFGIGALAATSAPAGASARIGLGQLQQLLSGAAYPIQGDSLRGLMQSSVGDVELAASVQWLDTFRGDEQARLAPRGLQLRSTATAGYRVGTGRGDFAGFWYDVPTGTGANALLLRSATDVVLGRRAWATAIVRYARPFADSPIVRIPAEPGDLFVPLAREQQIERTLGSELEVELTPRLTITDFLGVWGQYRLRSKGADRHVGTFDLPEDGETPATTIDASILDVNSEMRDQRAGLGVTYSTLAAFARGRSTLPLEVSWVYRTTLAGAGGAPRFTSQLVQVRLYARLFGPRTRGLTGVR